MSRQDWERSHRRYRLVTEMIERPELLSEPLRVDLRAEFGSREQALLAVHRRWDSLMRGCLDLELEVGAYTSGADALTRVARRAMAHSPALHRTIDMLAEDRVISALDDRFHLRLAQSIGIGHRGSTPSDAVSEVRRILARAAVIESVGGSSRRHWRPRNPLQWMRRSSAVEMA